MRPPDHALDDRRIAFLLGLPTLADSALLTRCPPTARAGAGQRECLSRWTTDGTGLHSWKEFDTRHLHLV